MNKKNVVLIFTITFFVAAGVLCINGSLAYMESPVICSKCHAMVSYYESYINSEGNSFIDVHKNEEVSCIDCHSSPGRENRDKVRTTILKKMVSYIYIGNVVADTSLLKADCTKCHDVDTTFNDTEINPHAGVQSCEVSCHLVHEDLILGDFMKMDCAECHVEPDVTGRHANVNCIGCHPIHESIPLCTGCHASHDNSDTKVENTECLVCHGGSAHTITLGTYNEISTIPTEKCAGCHKEQYQKLVSSIHGDMNTCVGCHPSHGEIRECVTCHVYSRSIPITYISAYNANLNAHMDAHILLEGEGCSACHGAGGVIHKTCTDCHIQDPHTI